MSRRSVLQRKHLIQKHVTGGRNAMGGHESSSAFWAAHSAPLYTQMAAEEKALFAKKKRY